MPERKTIKKAQAAKSAAQSRTAESRHRSAMKAARTRSKNSH